VATKAHAKAGTKTSILLYSAFSRSCDLRMNADNCFDGLRFTYSQLVLWGKYLVSSRGSSLLEDFFSDLLPGFWSYWGQQGVN
jgi:hypothetical protein